MEWMTPWLTQQLKLELLQRFLSQVKYRFESTYRTSSSTLRGKVPQFLELSLQGSLLRQHKHVIEHVGLHRLNTRLTLVKPLHGSAFRTPQAYRQRSDRLHATRHIWFWDLDEHNVGTKLESSFRFFGDHQRIHQLDWRPWYLHVYSASQCHFEWY